MEELLKSLIDIQQRLDVPKSQVNAFGHYNYRSLEDIEAAIKPLLHEHQCGIRFSDQIVEHAGRTFLQTTLYFFNTKGAEISTTAEAEHAAQKSGMDASQITGATSSYARKYAMNAMFAIDDTKDADTNQYQEQTTQRKQNTPRKATAPQQQKPQNDRYSGIRTAISLAMSTEELLTLYNSHKIVVDSDPNIKALFSQRKNELKSQPKAA